MGQVIRMEESRKTKKNWENKPVGQRKRGRPKKSWNEDVEEFLNRKGINMNTVKDNKTENSGGD